MHMDKPGCSKRTRNSSSDSEDKITQDSKRERSDVSDRSGSTMGSVTEDTMSDLNSKLESIIEGQDKLRRDINENFICHTKSMATLIDQKMSALRQEIDGKLQAMGQELQGVRDRVATMEAAQHDREAADGVALTGLQQRIDSLESKVSDAAEPLHEPARSKLIVKGLRESDSENERELLQQFEDLLSRLGVQVRAIAAVRVGSSTRGRKPRPVSFTTSQGYPRLFCSVYWTRPSGPGPRHGGQYQTPHEGITRCHIQERTGCEQWEQRTSRPIGT